MKVAVLSLLVSTVVLNLLPLMREDVLYLIVEIPDLPGSWDRNGVNGLLGLPKAPRVNSPGV